MVTPSSEMNNWCSHFLRDKYVLEYSLTTISSSYLSKPCVWAHRKKPSHLGPYASHIIQYNINLHLSAACRWYHKSTNTNEKGNSRNKSEPKKASYPKQGSFPFWHIKPGSATDMKELVSQMLFTFLCICRNICGLLFTTKPVSYLNQTLMASLSW